MLPITATTAAILGLFYVFLSGRVIANRVQGNASLGSGGDSVVPSGSERDNPLLIAVRAHANFAEYVPLALILLGLDEAAGAKRWLVGALAVTLVVARIAHPIGLSQPVPNPFRAGGAALTLSVVGIASLTLLAVLWL